MSTSEFGRRTALGAFFAAAWTLARPRPARGPRSTTTTIAPTTTGATTTTTPATPDLSTTLGVYPGFGGVGCHRLITVYEPFLGRQYRYAIQNIDHHPDRMTSSAWGLTNELGAWQSVGADDARHVRLAVTVPLRLAIDGNRGGVTSTVAATIRKGLIATANGALDGKFRTCANHLVAGGHGDAIVRIGHEPDIAWYPWSMLGGNADVYVAAFRRCRAVLKSVSASFAVDYNVDSDARLPYPGFRNRLSAGYPGDDAVDIVGIDVYNRAPWDTIRAKLDATAAFAADHGKPMSVPEWGLWKNETGDDPTFIQHMHDWFAARPASGPGSLLYQGYFWHSANSNFDPTTIGGATYRAPNAKARYQRLFGA